VGQLRTVTGASERAALDALKGVGWASVEAAVERYYEAGGGAGGGGGGGSAAGREAAEAKKAEAFFLDYKGESEPVGLSLSVLDRGGWARDKPSLPTSNPPHPSTPSLSLSRPRARALITAI